MSTTANGTNSVEDADMSDCDGEKVLTMVDVLKEQEDFEEDANAVLGASDDKNCTFNMGYVKRQAIYACVTCCTEAKVNPSKRAGVCLACSLTCHENHELVELYTKRNFRCDCGNSKFNSHPCQFIPSKIDLNDNNKYNQNFSGIYCTCHRPYPDPESKVEDEMIQCIICEDWLHASHLDAAIPSNDQYSEMICKGCMENNPFLHDYSELAVTAENADIEILSVVSSTTEKLMTNNDTKENENDKLIDGDGNPSCSSDQTLLENNDIEMADMSCEAKDIANTNGNDDSKTKHDLEENSNTPEQPTNIDVIKTEVQDNIENEEQKVYEEDNNKDLESEQIESTDSVTTLLKSKSEEEKESPEVTETSEIAITSEEPHKLFCSQNIELTDGESTNIAKNEFGNEDSEKINTLIEDTKDSGDALKEQSNLDSEKIEEERLLADPTLEDNIQDLANLINEKADSDNKSTEANNSNKISSETPNEIINMEGEQDIALEDSISKKNNIHSENELPNSAGNGSEIIFDTNTIALKDNEIDTADHTSNPDVINEIMAASEIKSIDDDDENLSSGDDQLAEDNNESIESSKDSDSIEICSIYIEREEENSQNEFEDFDINSKCIKIEVSENTTNSESEMDSSSCEPPEDVRSSNDTLDKKETENKRKLSTENNAEEMEPVKRTKLNEVKLCVRQREGKRIHKGATFWPPHFRQKLCTCNECLAMYKDLSVLFLIDLEDTVSFYENLGKEKVKIEGKPKSQYEKGLEALSSLDRVQQINALTEYNRMRDKLLDFLKSFKEKKEVVKEEDIKAFFANMKPRREPDGVYFCR